MQNRTVRHVAEKGKEWFLITDEEYSRIMDILKRQMKAECGFIPDLAYGENNFDRLVNFTRFPFVPELNAFSWLFGTESKGRLFQDTKHNQCVYPSAKAIRSLQDSPDGVQKFLELCQVPYTPKTNRIFLKGHRTFTAFLCLWHCGFRNIPLIEELIDADDQHRASIEYRYTAALGIPASPDVPKTPVLCLKAEDFIPSAIPVLLETFGEKTTGRFLLSGLRHKDEWYIMRDAVQFFIRLKADQALPADVIRKIGKEGFTGYNHNMLLHIYNDLHPERNGCTINLPITYSDDEAKLAWEKDGYQFCLPEDTNRLVDIGAKMNICVGHLYREKAVTKQCTIVFVKKNDEYQLCIEVCKTGDNRFKLIQQSAFSNQPPMGQDLLAINRWCLEKNIACAA